mmetsp:Transcript_97546/g.314971  ORF Transcript_97546/g.314971 Transcript_97546/m.314971 type:complete len:344 (-) Transcript_97546:321-1352(-)
MAWRSLAGFQSGSYMTKRLAPIRFRPQPPAFEESRKTKALGLSGLLKSSTSFMRLPMVVLPSRRCTGQPYCPHIFSMKSSVCVQFETITTRSPLPDVRTTVRSWWRSRSLPESSSWTGFLAERRPTSRLSISANIARVSASSKPSSMRSVAERTRKGWFTRIWSFMMVPRMLPDILMFWSSRSFRATFDRRKTRYNLRWKSVGLTKTLRICFGGRKRAFSRFVRRRMKASVTSETLARVSSPSCRSSADAVGSRPRRIGAAWRRRNSLMLPRMPGFAMFTSVKNSSRLFWIGVPEISSRRVAASPAMHFVVAAPSLLSLCASSQTTRSMPQFATSFAWPRKVS